MKTRHALMALAVAGALPMGAAADTSIYGKMWVTLQALNDDVAGTETRDDYELLSNASRLGVMGSTKLGDTLNAIYKAEYEIAVDGDDFTVSGSKGHTFKSRNIYVGLQGSMGTLIAGKHDTPTKLAFVKVDRFNDLLYGDVRNVLVGRNRENDIVMYTTPATNGLSATVAFQPGEASPDPDNDDPANGWSGSLNYVTGGLTLALAGDHEILGTNLVRLVADYRVGAFGIGGMVQSAEDSEDNDPYYVGISKVEAPLAFLRGGATKFDEQDGFVVGSDYSIGKWKLKGQYGQSTSDERTGLGDVDITQISLGLDYKLADKTVLMGYYTDVEADESYSIPDFDAQSDTFGLGIVHDF